MSDLINSAEIALTECLNLRRLEQLLIVCDSACYDIGRAFYDAGEGKCKEAVMIMIQSRKNNGSELPEFFGSWIDQFDIVIIPTIKSLSRKHISKVASEQGIRIVTLPGITNDSFIRTMKTDWRKLGVYTRKMTGKLSAAQIITIKTSAGTNLTFSTAGQNAWADDGQIMTKGTFGDLPAGEACIRPLDNSAEGVLVIDGSFSLVEGILDKPLVLTLKEGKVIKIEGHNYASELDKIFTKFHESRSLAEFGIGTHDTVMLCGNNLEDKKVRGTVHFGIGNWLFNDILEENQIHFDGVIQKPSVWIDGKLLINQGEHL